MNAVALNQTIKSALEYIGGLPPSPHEDGYFDIDKFFTDRGNAEEDVEMVKTILKYMGIIERARGTRMVTRGDRLNTDDIERELKDIERELNDIITLESNLPAKGKLARLDAINLLGGSESRFERSSRVLYLAGVAKRVRGAIMLQNNSAGETPATSSVVAGEREREADYYPAAMYFIRQTIVNTACEAETSETEKADGVLISGGNKRLGGPWNTPDVVGWWVEGCPALYSAALRVISTEVKLKFDRHGIAQALSYKRFSHYSWLLVPIPRQELVAQGELVSECAVAGIGLACFAQQNSTAFIPYITPAYCRPDEVQINKMLKLLFKEETDDSRSYQEIANTVRRVIGRTESSV